MKTTALIIFTIVLTMNPNNSENRKDGLEKQVWIENETTDDERCKYIFTTNWEKVEVEVRAGNQLNCENNDFVDTFVLYKGEQQVLYADGKLCYRRRARPSDPNSNWANWTSSVMCAFDRDIEIQVR